MRSRGEETITEQIKQVPTQLCTFGNGSTSCLLDLVKVKVQFSKRRFPIKLLVHSQASMEINSLGIHEVTHMLRNKRYQKADHFITSHALIGIEILIGTDYSLFHIATKESEGYESVCN